MNRPALRSIITCDLEGRIETFNEGAEALFGYAPGEVIGRKRVSLFSPGPIVLGHVNAWLATARNEGAFESQTVFVRKDGTPFAATIRITPTYKKQDGAKKHIGYCGVTSALPDVSISQAMPKIHWTTRLVTWMVITRAPFLTATLMPLFIGAAWAAAYAIDGAFPWALFASTLIGASSLQIAANTFNDYFDWRSGTDPANRDYFLPYTGGSRSIELGIISERRLLWIAFGALATAAVATVPILIARGPVLLELGLIGAALAYFYTAPPLRLAARRGLGELSVVLGFGPLLTT
jgi:1,4-dihydroxy-2-naphthoate polyprenyltransferase